ncbi:MAG: winged helix-turn-helix domain-containing protein [Gammaproteobacteria bacterium]|nr:winged helix-turn-helix domain-containing protein [Gammaproteobacteria bacterium]
MPRTAVTPLMVSVRTVRRFILGCQGLWPGRRSAGRPGTRQALHQSGLVQVDPLNVVARSHDLALHARVWDYRPEHLDHVLYTSREFFDYGGTLYVLPMGELPYWRVHMARRAAEPKSRAFAADYMQLLTALREDISSRGAVASRDYAGPRRRSRFRSDKATARALRHLWLTGELMTYGRRGFERLYALRGDVAPVDVQHAATPDEADDFFARKALALLGLATAPDWARRFRHLARRRADPDGERRRLDDLLTSGTAVRTQVGDGTALYLLGERAKELEAVERGSVPRAWRTPRADTLTEATFLPPLEFVTARGRAAQWFDFDYVWEVYKPATERRWGYYVMPIMYGDRLVGRADLRMDRAARTLIVPHLWLERAATARDADFVRALGLGLRRLAEWAGGDDVRIGATSPTGLRGSLARSGRVE